MTTLSESPAGKLPPPPEECKPHVLRFTPPLSDYWQGPEHREYYFVAHGDSYRQITLIAETTPDRAQARVFPSFQKAEAAWDLSGRPAGWEVVPV